MTESRLNGLVQQICYQEKCVVINLDTTTSFSEILAYLNYY